MTRFSSRSQPHDDDATDAFVVRLMENRHRIYAFITKQLVNPADVEDVFQRTSIVLWRKMDRFDPSRSFFHWAAGIAMGEVRNHLRSRRRSRLHFDPELVALLARESMDESEQSDARLRAMRLCMGRLDERQQELLRACYEGDASITDVAATLGRPRSALYKQLSRLRDKLLSCIRGQLAGEGGLA